MEPKKGTIILWSFWPSFVAGPAGETSRHMAMTNTYLSLSASTIGVFIISALTSGKTRLTLAHIQVATLAGGVVMSTPSGTPVHPFGALLIGFIAGIVSTLGFKYSQVGYFKPAFPTSSSFSRLYQDMLSMLQVLSIYISTLL